MLTPTSKLAGDPEIWGTRLVAEGGVDPDALRGVLRGVEAARNLLLLEQQRLADGYCAGFARDVVLVDRGRRDQRLVAVAVNIGGEDAVDVRCGGVGGFGEGDGDGWFHGWNPHLRSEMWGTRVGGEAEDFEGGQAELAAGGDGKGLEEVEVFERVVRVERDEFGPAIAIGRSDRSGDYAEVLSGVVGADVEEAAAMVGVVLLLVKARGDELEFAGGAGGGEEANLIGGVAGGFDQQVLAVASAADADIEAGIFFEEDQAVLFEWRADGVAEDVVVALGGFVLSGIEEGAGVGRPGERANPLGGVGQVGEGAQDWIVTANVERELAEAGGVSGVSEQVAVGADGHAAEGHEGFSLGKDIHVEDDLFRLGGIEQRIEVSTAEGAGGRTAAEDGILAALDGAGGVEPVALAVGHGFVRLLDVGEHLGVEPGLQPGSGGHECGGVGILGMKIGE